MKTHNIILYTLLLTLNSADVFANEYNSTYVFDKETKIRLFSLHNEMMHQKIDSAAGLSEEKRTEYKDRVFNAHFKWKMDLLYFIRSGCEPEIKKLRGAERKPINAELMALFEKNKDTLSTRCTEALKSNHGEVLLEDTTIHDVSIPKGSVIRSGKTLDKIIKYINRPWSSSEPDTVTLHYTNIFPSKPIEINGASYKNLIRLENGKLASAYLAEEAIIKGVSYKPSHSPVRFQLNGEVLHGMLSKDTIVKEVPLKGGSYVGYYYGGNIHNGTLSKNISYQNIKLLKDKPVHFYDNRFLKSGYIQENIKIASQNYKAQQYIHFSASGTTDEEAISRLSAYYKKYENNPLKNGAIDGLLDFVF